MASLLNNDFQGTDRPTLTALQSCPGSQVSREDFALLLIPFTS